MGRKIGKRHKKDFRCRCKCELQSRSKLSLVMGWGSLHYPCEVMFVGTFPDESSQITGRPFFGKYRKMVLKILKKASNMAGWKRTPKHYLAYLVCCQVKDENGLTGKGEIVWRCSESFRKKIEILSPEVVVFLGNEAHKFGKKIVSNSIALPTLDSLFLKGGVESTEYRAAARKLADAIILQ